MTSDLSYTSDRPNELTNNVIGKEENKQALPNVVTTVTEAKQGARYIKKRIGNELTRKILEYNGISIEQLPKQRSVISICPKCNFTNILENKYCASCSYPLTPEAYDEIKRNEEKRFIELERKYSNK